MKSWLITLLTLILSLLALGGSNSCYALNSYLESEDHKQNSYYASHGMLVFGDDKQIYISHLPLYDAPHDRQIVAPLIIKNKKIKAFLQLMFRQNQRVTLLPEPFDLRKLKESSLQLKATFYAGHFERGGKSMLEGMVVIETPVIWHELTQNLSQKSYWQLNNDQASYLIHRIGGRPSFDFIAKLSNKSANQKKLQLLDFKVEDIDKHQEALKGVSYQLIYQEYSDLQ